MREPYPRASAVVMLAWRVGAVTELVSLAVGDLDGRERVTVRCAGKGCRFTRKRHRVKKDVEVLRLARDVRGMKLRDGATLSVAVRRADGVTKTIAFRMRKGKAPRRTQRCTAPGNGTVAGC